MPQHWMGFRCYCRSFGFSLSLSLCLCLFRYGNKLEDGLGHRQKGKGAREPLALFGDSLREIEIGLWVGQKSGPYGEGLASLLILGLGEGLGPYALRHVQEITCGGHKREALFLHGCYAIYAWLVFVVIQREGFKNDSIGNKKNKLNGLDRLPLGKALGR